MSALMTQEHIIMNIIIQGVVVLKELIFNSFYFGLIGGLERTESTDLMLPGNES